MVDLPSAQDLFKGRNFDREIIILCVETGKNRRQHDGCGPLPARVFLQSFSDSSGLHVPPEWRSKASVPANGQRLPSPSGQGYPR